MMELAPGSSHPRMCPSDLDPCLVPVLAAFLLAGQNTLSMLEFLLCPAKEPGRGDLAAVGEHREVSEPEVNTGYLLSLGHRARLKFDDEAKYRPAVSLITVTEDGLDGSGRDQRTETSPILGRRSF